ncbi:arsenate reductase (glutaredoxin) [Methylophaga sp. OBS1]|uniref:arsenate reductase (glutaredoxin) n=1 Tax=Methylophaga sp. OBS1 TaxID=2991933 RepID=UPI0022517CAA|nr:arsenate reductase (glutaredoxin) [Methylophaga sp. OBS1]MCX4193238.1 arsenate reductase (glutaredoxin) [Methylophaga sp. OBS1]
MSNIQILHNPRCSKSRQTLALLEEKGIEPEVIKYIDTPPTATELKAILQKLGISARDLLRKGEDDYKALNLKDRSLSEEALIEAMVEHPKLIERPIVIKGNKARLGRPPESVLDII